MGVISYITSRCGEVKNLSEVSSILDDLFKTMYHVDYKEEIEIRYKTVTETYTDEEGNAGLDSNARKNRSGTTMEGILERHVAKISETLGLEWKAQATAPFIKDNWNIEVPVDKSERRFDVAIYSKEQHKVWLVETNYYGGGGSKLKAVAGEFTELSQFVVTSNDNVEFVWVTDGQGWKTAHLPLSEAFGHITNIFNLNMLKEDFLADLLTK